MNKAVPSLVVAMVAGMGMGLMLGRLLSGGRALPRAAVATPPLPWHYAERIRRFLDVERN